MWRIYIILALWSHPLNAQYGGHVQNSRGGGIREGGREQNALKTTDDYSDYKSRLPPSVVNNNNTNVILQIRTYNKNSRDSYGYKYNLQENQLFSRGKESQIKKPNNNEVDNAENSLSTISVVFQLDSTTSQPPRTWKIPTSNSFDAKLFDVMSARAQSQNLVYSPISLEILLVFISTISDGKLYEELAQLLTISKNRTYIANVFEKVLQQSSIATQPTTIIIANKLYYDYRFGPVDQSVRNIAKRSFGSELEQVNFFKAKEAAESINSWVGNKTRNLIKEIVSSSSISGETNALLLNSIYFKSEWLTKFAPDDTERQNFFLSRQINISVDMMYNEDVFRYGDFSDDLQASVLELPYKTSNLSMLLILPLDIEGLPNLERKLKFYDFNSISQKLKREIVTVKLPKFKIEYEINMIAALQEMGLHALFNNAGVINIFRDPQKPLKVDQLKHKCSIIVNEDGTEAAATTVSKFVPLSLPPDMKYFVADHPFVFVIRNTNTTFFMGHVARF